jgi:superfamily I DNA and/or RNA helicase
MERAVDAGVPAAMLAEQYRMHPSICAPISAAFYGGKLKTAAGMLASRPHPSPCVFVDVAGAETFHKGAGYSNEEEALRYGKSECVCARARAQAGWVGGGWV